MTTKEKGDVEIIEFETDSDISKRKLSVKFVIKAILVRVLLVTHSIVTIWRTTDVLNNNYYWCLAITNILLIIDGLYTVIRLKGQERKWFCPCFLFYLFSVVPALWLLEIDRVNKYDDLISNDNITDNVQELSQIQGVSIPIKLDPDTWREVLEQSMLFILIIGRWMLPRGTLTRDQLSQLLFVYIGSASDVMELFVVFEEPEIRSDTVLTYIIFSVWTLSLLQFTLVLTATRDSRRSQAVVEEDGNEMFKRRQGCGVCSCGKLFELEIWSLMISILIMDGPFLAVRVYALARYQLITFGILFFVCKNSLMIALLFYRIVVVCHKIYFEEEDDKDNVSGKNNRVGDIQTVNSKKRTIMKKESNLSTRPSSSSTKVTNLDDVW
ncbi:transmembrane protein 26-like [Saccostrea echinata]|uniref:transmembrane protein 26-like n=1 Tax=Saccostrea echinata TaxID=191078 RepID=UPI002A819152|nr:transmembrane protein 26-like [Saccostrea echinata]